MWKNWGVDIVGKWKGIDLSEVYSTQITYIVEINNIVQL